MYAVDIYIAIRLPLDVELVDMCENCAKRIRMCQQQHHWNLKRVYKTYYIYKIKNRMFIIRIEVRDRQDDEQREEKKTKQTNNFTCFLFICTEKRESIFVDVNKILLPKDYYLLCCFISAQNSTVIFQMKWRKMAK